MTYWFNRRRKPCKHSFQFPRWGIGLTRGYRCRIRAQKAKKETCSRSPSRDPEEPTLSHCHLQAVRGRTGGKLAREGPSSSKVASASSAPSWAEWGESEGWQEGAGRRKEDAGGVAESQLSSFLQPRLSLRKLHPRTGHPGSVMLSHRDRTSCPSQSTCSLTGNKGMTLSSGRIPAQL